MAEQGVWDLKNWNFEIVYELYDIRISDLRISGA